MPPTKPLPTSPQLPIGTEIIRKRAVTVVGLLVVFLIGALAGIGFDHRRNGLDLSKFWAVYGLIQHDSVHDVDKTKLVDGAIQGLVTGLGDPFSSYMNLEEKKSFNDELSGQFEGVGAELTEKNGVITVVSPLAGSPAEAAGLKANDTITKVNGEATDGLTVDDVVKKIRGPKDTEVTVTVVRDGGEPFDLKITRKTITVKSVSSKMLGQVGYMEINQFGDDTVDGVAQAVKDLTAQNPKAIVVDLRNNPGGFLNAVPPIAGHFLAPSVIVKEKYRGGKTNELRSTTVPEIPSIPVYVLINGGSASAAEILAGALQDYKRATLIGEKSFGKGSVQELIDLPGNTALRLTIAEWLTPLDRAINKVGIGPDVEVKDEKTNAKDPVLDKALELANK